MKNKAVFNVLKGYIDMRREEGESLCEICDCVHMYQYTLQKIRGDLACIQNAWKDTLSLGQRECINELIGEISEVLGESVKR